jgi:hypothetical protein
MARKTPRERARAHAGKILRAYYELAKVTDLPEETIADLDEQLSAAHFHAMESVRSRPTEFRFQDEVTAPAAPAEPPPKAPKAARAAVAVD